MARNPSGPKPVTAKEQADQQPQQQQVPAIPLSTAAELIGLQVLINHNLTEQNKTLQTLIGQSTINLTNLEAQRQQLQAEYERVNKLVQPKPVE